LKLSNYSSSNKAESVGSFDERCKIPFQINEKDYYFCQLNSSSASYKCKIENGESRACRRGIG